MDKTSDELTSLEAKLIAANARIAQEYLDAIVTETRSGYVSRRYICDKINNVLTAVRSIADYVEN